MTRICKQQPESRLGYKMLNVHPVIQSRYSATVTAAGLMGGKKMKKQHSSKHLVAWPNMAVVATLGEKTCQGYDRNYPSHSASCPQKHERTAKYSNQRAVDRCDAMRDLDSSTTGLNMLIQPIESQGGDDTGSTGSSPSWDLPLASQPLRYVLVVVWSGSMRDRAEPQASQQPALT